MESSKNTKVASVSIQETFFYRKTQKKEIKPCLRLNKYEKVK